MQYAGFFSEIFESPIIALSSGLEKYRPYLIAHQEGKILDFPELPPLRMSLYDIQNNFINQPETKPEDSVAVIPVNGLITREGSWWDYGANEIADLMVQAFADPSIKAVVLRMNSIGGTIDCAFPFKAAFTKSNGKPVIGAIDAKAYSMGYYALSFCDQILAVDDMAGLGSIGVMASLRNYDEAYKQMGIKNIEVYPPESNWKNKPEREALKGKTELLISETLSPWAQHFQELVKANRKSLNEDAEGVLAGRTYFARDCGKKGNGLIDGIMPFDEIVKYAANYERNSKINKFFN